MQTGEADKAVGALGETDQPAAEAAVTGALISVLLVAVILRVHGIGGDSLSHRAKFGPREAFGVEGVGEIRDAAGGEPRRQDRRDRSPRKLEHWRDFCMTIVVVLMIPINGKRLPFERLY